jgi:hypothetical protein
VTLPLPWVAGQQRHTPAVRRAEGVPCDRLAAAVQSAERLTQHGRFIFLAAHRDHDAGFSPLIVAGLLDRADQDGVRTDLDENATPSAAPVAKSSAAAHPRTALVHLSHLSDRPARQNIAAAETQRRLDREQRAICFEPPPATASDVQ